MPNPCKRIAARRERTPSTQNSARFSLSRITTANRLLLSLLFAAAFLAVFASSSQAQTICGGNPCILISNYSTGQVEIWPDTGGSSSLTTAFLTGAPAGHGGGEGIACVNGSSSNVMYVSDNGAYVDAFNLSTGAYIGAAFSGGSAITGMAINGAGNIIYAADYGDGSVWTLVPTGPYSLSPYAAETTVSAGAHDVALGTYPATLAGDVFTSYFQNDNTGASQFLNVGTYTPLTFQGDALPYGPPYNSPNAGCATFTNGSHCWTRITGMVFDAAGKLWANSATSGDNGTFEFVQSGSTPPEFVPVNFTPSVTTSSFPIGITIAPAGDINAGNILTADFNAGTISMITPGSCTGTVSTPGACTRTTFIPNVGANPKYVAYNQSCPSVANDGYIEICKQSNPSLPVTGTFDFTITAPSFNSGPIPVPVGECSGPIQVPSGTVTVAETPQSPIQVTGVSAYSYNASGGLVDQVVAYPAVNPPNPYAAEIGVEPGNDVALETIATFTNSSYDDGQTGQLKICKVAGPGIMVGQPFTFMTSYTSSTGKITSAKYSVEAGPGPQGYCILAGAYPVGTQVTVRETLPAGDYTSINVQPPANAGKETANSVVTTIGQGVTEVTFTNTTTPPTCGPYTFTGAPTEAADGTNFTVTATPSSNPTPVITVTGPCTVSGDVVTMTGAVGTCTITATWPAFEGCAATKLVQKTKAEKSTTGTTTTAVACSPNPADAGESVTCTASISNQSGLAVTGTVKWSLNTGCGTTTVSSGNPGVASCTWTPVKKANDTITAAYSGDSNNSASKGSLVETVN